jgi:hypothetical protein
MEGKQGLARIAFLEVAWIFTEVLGYSAVLLIGYSVYASFTEPWPPLERGLCFIFAHTRWNICD